MPMWFECSGMSSPEIGRRGTMSYVLVETIALLQIRVGLEPARDFDEHVLRMFPVEWTSEALHRRGARI